MNHLSSLVRIATIGVTATVLATAVPAQVPVPSNATLIASGLNGPRGLAFGPDGALYVAEAGTGGKTFNRWSLHASGGSSRPVYRRYDRPHQQDSGRKDLSRRFRTPIYCRRDGRCYWGRRPRLP